MSERKIAEASTGGDSADGTILANTKACPIKPREALLE